MYTCSDLYYAVQIAVQRINRSLRVMIFSFLFVLFSFASFVWGDADEPIRLLEFTSSGCGACQLIKPLLNEMKAKGYPIRTISYDLPENKEIFRHYQISSMPSFVMLCHGQESGRFVCKGQETSEVQSRLLSLFHDANERLKAQQGKIAAETTSDLSTGSLQTGEIRQMGATSHEAAVPAQVPLVSQQAATTSSREESAQVSQFGQNQATVRIRVFNNTAVDRGTGTIIHVNRGQANPEALVLTCGHIFRPSQGKGRIELDLFHPETGQQITVGGECIRYDDEIDIAFIGMPLPFAVTPVDMVPPEYKVKTGDRVVSIGCSNGENPTTLEHQVLSVDKKYFKPSQDHPEKKSFYYIQVSTAPVGGRSGGGLFVRDDTGLHLLGVCNAGDTETNEGFFVPTKIIYEEMLACRNLAFVYNDLLRRSAGGGITPVSATTSAGSPQQEPIRQAGYEGQQIPSAVAAPVQNLPLATSNAPIHPLTAPQASIPKETKTVAADGDQNAMLLKAGLDELKKRQMEGAEIICIVKWPDQQNTGQSREMEVIRLPKK